MSPMICVCFGASRPFSSRMAFSASIALASSVGSPTCPSRRTVSLFFDSPTPFSIVLTSLSCCDRFHASIASQ